MKKTFLLALGLLSLAACSSSDPADPTPSGGTGGSGNTGGGGSGATGGSDATGGGGSGATGGSDATGGGGDGTGGRQELDCAQQPEKCYVRAEGSKLRLDGKPYRYMGTNFWSAPYISRERLRTELDILEAHGALNLRIMALSEGDIPAAQQNDQQYGPQRIFPASSDKPCADAQLEAFADNLVTVLDEMHSRGMKAVMTLNDFWHWSGGMPQYMKWAHEQPTLSCGEDFSAYQVGLTHPTTGASCSRRTITCRSPARSGSSRAQARTARPWPSASGPSLTRARSIRTRTPGPTRWISSLFFCNKKAQEFYFSRAKVLIEKLKDHPGIMAWQLGNEPRSFKGWGPLFKLWVERNAKFIKDIDPNHLVSIGSEGDLSYNWGDYANSDYEAFHDVPGIDYLTFHVWPENWSGTTRRCRWTAPPSKGLLAAITKSNGYIDAQLAHARALNKPIVVEEFGLAWTTSPSRSHRRSPSGTSITPPCSTPSSRTPELAGVNFGPGPGPEAVGRRQRLLAPRQRLHRRSAP